MPSKTVPTACLYKNALAVSITTNDAAGYAINEYLDSTPDHRRRDLRVPERRCELPAGRGHRRRSDVRPLGKPGRRDVHGQALTSCAAGGSIVPAGTGGVSSAGANPGNPGAPGLEFYSPSGTALSMVTGAGPTVSGGVVTTMYAGEDIQVNLAPNAPSAAPGATGIYMTIQLVPN